MLKNLFVAFFFTSGILSAVEITHAEAHTRAAGHQNVGHANERARAHHDLNHRGNLNNGGGVVAPVVVPNAVQTTPVIVPTTVQTIPGTPNTTPNNTIQK
jgi:hypothetical protein